MHNNGASAVQDLVDSNYIQNCSSISDSSPTNRKMWNALRRLKTLVTQQGFPGSSSSCIEEEDEPEGHKSKRSTSRKRSKKCDKMNLCEGDGEHLDVGGNDTKKQAVWDVDFAEEASEEDEDSQTKALRLFRFKILSLSCSMDPTPEAFLDKTDPKYKPSPDYDTVKACRLVCKDWYDEISAIFLDAGKPLLHVSPASHLKRKKQGLQDPVQILEMLKGPLVRPENLSPTSSDLTFPPFKLSLPPSFFYKEIENSFIYTAWPHFERHIYELNFNLPADSTMRFYWPTLNLEALKKVRFKCTNDTQGANKLGGLSALHYNPFLHGNYMYLIQQFLNAAPNAESFTLHCYASHFAPSLYRVIFPAGIKFMDVPLVKMGEDELEDCLKYGSSPKGHLNRKRSTTKKSLKHLILRAPMRTFRREEEISTCYGSYLLQKFGGTLEKLELDVSGQEMDHIVWTMRRDYVYEPLALAFTKPMTRLSSLTLHAGIWEISEMKSYKTILPVLKTLKLTLLTKENQIESLYKSRSESVEKLTLSFVQDIPCEVIQGFADSLPFLKELDICIKEKNPGLEICFQSFTRLTKLHVVYSNCNSEEGKELLNWSVTGIIPEDWKAIRNEELTILDAMKKYEDVPSLRNLRDLEELKLLVKSNGHMDVSVMLRTVFLRMENLKRIILSEKTLFIEDDQKDYIRKENQYGMLLEWV